MKYILSKSFKTYISICCISIPPPFPFHSTFKIFVFSNYDGCCSVFINVYDFFHSKKLQNYKYLIYLSLSRTQFSFLNELINSSYQMLQLLNKISYFSPELSTLALFLALWSISLFICWYA